MQPYVQGKIHGYRNEPARTKVMQTLEELKAENAAIESAAQEPEPSAPQAVEENLDVVEDVAAESIESAVEEPEAAADGEGETEGDDLEAWQKTGEVSNDKKFTDSDIGAVKKKLRSKLEKEHTGELDQLRAEINSLKASSAPQQRTAPTLVRPKMDDYDDDEGFDNAVDAYHDARFEAKLANREGQMADKTRQREAQQTLLKSVDGHYERAAGLVKDSGISEDVFRDSDAKVRSAMESIRPGQGDDVVDYLINALGEGSEKVMYYLGRNAQELEILKSKLVSDPQGMTAMAYLGQKLNQLASPQKRRNTAPKPATQINGDAGGSSSHAKLKSDYAKADKAGNTQARFDARRAGKKAGADVSNW